MKRPLLFGYQLATGLLDTGTGVLLILTPAATIRLMGLHAVASASLPFLSYIGTFVLATGLACLYGALLTTRLIFAQKLEVVWILTGITRACVSLFLIAKLASGTLETGWITVAATDGVIMALQALGLSKGWLANAPA